MTDRRGLRDVGRMGRRKAAIASIYEFEVPRPDGSPERLDRYRGEVLLVVNTAAKCGLTPQYEGLEALQQRFGDRGFRVLGFPSNSFLQEPDGDGGACPLRYGATFPIFAKVAVNGAGTHPLFRFLKAQKPGLLGTEAIKWNFTKFLVDRSGAVVERFAPRIVPAAIAAPIERLL